ncbi:MAG: hypothetical protein RR949_06885, partial [Oscillospiraceae bacterium]
GKLTITAIGKGGLVEDYSYSWKNEKGEDYVDGNGIHITTVPKDPNPEAGKPAEKPLEVNGVFVIDKLTAATTVKSTITGRNKVGASFKTTLNGAPFQNGTVKQYTLQSSFGTYKLTGDDETGYTNTEVPAGTYELIETLSQTGIKGAADEGTTYTENYYTGRTVKVGTDAMPLTLNYVTLNYDITPTNGVYAAYIRGYYAKS